MSESVNIPSGELETAGQSHAAGAAGATIRPTNPDRVPQPVVDVHACVREALAALSVAPERDVKSGRFVPGTLAAMTTGARSGALWAALAPAKRELLEKVKADLGSEGAETALGLYDAYTEARLLRTSMFERLVDLGGPVTSKGAARALYTAYLSALDREIKLAQAIGLERKARKVPSVSELLS